MLSRLVSQAEVVSQRSAGLRLLGLKSVSSDLEAGARGRSSARAADLCFSRILATLNARGWKSLSSSLLLDLSGFTKVPSREEGTPQPRHAPKLDILSAQHNPAQQGRRPTQQVCATCCTPLLAPTSGISIASDRAARACRRRRQRVRCRRDRRFHRETDAPALAWFLDAPPDTCWDAPPHSPVRTERPSETRPPDPLAGARTTEMLIDIRSSRRTDEDRHHGVRLRIRRSTSSQGMPAGPSRSSSSSLRSSSSRCAFVSGIASGVAERLSQSSSRRRKRSSALKFAMSRVPTRSVYTGPSIAGPGSRV